MAMPIQVGAIQNLPQGQYSSSAPFPPFGTASQPSSHYSTAVPDHSRQRSQQPSSRMQHSQQQQQQQSSQHSVSQQYSVPSQLPPPRPAYAPQPHMVPGMPPFPTPVQTSQQPLSQQPNVQLQQSHIQAPPLRSQQSSEDYANMAQFFLLGDQAWSELSSTTSGNCIASCMLPSWPSLSMLILSVAVRFWRVAVRSCCDWRCDGVHHVLLPRNQARHLHLI